VVRRGDSHLQVALEFQLVAGQLRGASGEQTLRERFNFAPFHDDSSRVIAEIMDGRRSMSKKSSAAMSAATQRRKRPSHNSIAWKGVKDEHNLQNQLQNRR
jgi:hypothetical protein